MSQEIVISYSWLTIINRKFISIPVITVIKENNIHGVGYWWNFPVEEIPCPRRNRLLEESVLAPQASSTHGLR